MKKLLLMIGLISGMSLQIDCMTARRFQVLWKSSIEKNRDACVRSGAIIGGAVGTFALGFPAACMALMCGNPGYSIIADVITVLPIVPHVIMIGTCPAAIAGGAFGNAIGKRRGVDEALKRTQEQTKRLDAIQQARGNRLATLPTEVTKTNTLAEA